VSGVIPGGYPNAALASNIAVNDVIMAVDGVSVTDESLMTQIKKARDAIGGKVKLQLDRNGMKHEIVLIRQRHTHVAQMEKIIKLLSEAREMAKGSPALENALRAVNQELFGLVSMTAEGEAAVADKIYQLQVTAQGYQCAKCTGAGGAGGKAQPAGGAGDKAQLDSLKEALQAAEANAKAAEEAANACKVRAWCNVSRRVCACVTAMCVCVCVCVCV